ncbi:MAG: cell division protease FtsH [Saprospiraceae bacterium]|jgi:cell division protease FtsH
MSENKKVNKGDKKPKGSFPIYIVYIAVVAVIIGFQFSNMLGGTGEITKRQFFEYLDNGQVEKILKVEETEHKYVEVFLNKESLTIDPHKDKAGQDVNKPQYKFDVADITAFEKSLTAHLSTDIGKTITLKTDFKHRQPPAWEGWIGTIVFFALMIGLWMFMMKRIGGGGGAGGQLFNIGKSKAKLFDKDTNVETTFADVAGLEEAKTEVMEIVDFLKSPKKYTILGAKIPKGALLVGPPGTGKTLIAKAVAGEAQVPFFSLSGSDFVEMFVGVGASRVRDLFKQAKEKSPCIIFIDEIDAIGRARGKNPAQNSNDERENTLNQLLTEMDGFGDNSGIIVLAATNRADILDRALLRPGRFDRQIYVDMPDKNEREAIFKVHLKPLKIDETVDVEFLASQTPGFSGADIANICNEAALIAARTDKKSVEKQDFLDAVDRIIGGMEKKNKVIKPGEKKVIAYHEAGHATVSWMLEHASPLVKVTIVPRGKSLGAAWYLPEERQITTKAQILDEMCAALGGRAAEQIMFGEVSTGALSDLEKVTKQAQSTILIYGLNDKIGNVSYYDSSGQSEYSLSKPYSEHTAQIIDEEINKMIEHEYKRAQELLSKHKEKLEVLAKQLLEKEVIFKEDLEKIFGKRPFETKEAGTIIEEATVVETSESTDTISTISSEKEDEQPNIQSNTKEDKNEPSLNS